MQGGFEPIFDIQTILINFANSWKMVGTYKSCAGDTGASMGHDL